MIKPCRACGAPVLSPSDREILRDAHLYYDYWIPFGVNPSQYHRNYERYWDLRKQGVTL